MPDTILIVDDTPANISVLVDALADTGHQLLVAEDGEEALEQTLHALPDLILLDVMMPGLDGYETCRRLKARPETRDIPVIFMTALHDTAEKVKAFGAGAVDYITKPIQHEEALARISAHLTLRRLRRELERELALRDRFMRIAAHDLRNPLCLILISGEMAKRKGLDGPIADYLDNINGSAREMRRIIDTFLGSQRGADNRPALAGRTDLNLIATAVAAQNEPAAERKSITLELELAEPLPSAVADAGYAYQALTNYLSNALKFLAPGGRVVVRTTAGEMHVRCAVADNGPGVAPGERGRLFTDGARLSNQPTAGEESTGYGLSIVKQLVEAEGGRVGADFPAEGGAVFWFELPVAPGA
jgi:two-component system sensor histidine kinase/response regulator